ncbi:MAG: glycosyltransferase family 2 protein, partial [Candidatus Nitrotoga sp.]
MLAPIILFAFSRPEHTRRTLEALAANALADQSDLIVYADAARSERDAEAVCVVRELIRAAFGFRSVTLIERDVNFGLARNIIEGVSEVLCQHERIIVLEDDMVTSPFFLTYMNEALERYANDNRIISIHGYVYPVAGALPEAFFLPGADCWGWATWRRGWAYFNPNGAQLLRELKQRKLEHAFDYGGSYPYTQMLEAQIAGANDSWAIRWYASAFLLGKLTLYPGRSLVHNIGNDASGTHCDKSSMMDSVLS